MDIESISENEPLINEAEVDLQQKIAARAHELWIQRGCPIGSPEEDWFRAEQELCADSIAMTAST